MKKISIIYWSGTGNTETMAKAIREGAKSENVDVKLVGVGEASVEDVSGADIVAFGCPAMGDEQLEENEMEPFIKSILHDIKDKDIVLFGSYGWGSGDWMTNWEDQMKEYGANLVEESLIINEEPDDDGLEKCEKLGEALAEK
ncbi:MULTISPECIES: flavodoxin [Clostridium]|uniref:Flavodoxin n=2 Tax=Clostridium TaxID=1485 RepID=D8GSP8_CLOLD|nr:MULTISPECIES: flavodoxin [Clostridium]ADK14468.1 predicted flavodoxin, short chain [Clostridium ljungdahlii DSM 13528]AGY77686.1 flavodoxin [Clostridium autoethanogenum DSM 10061]ALU37825.1 Flavodoxin [Clostridium autoethanogenum DSM 10061]OAA88111.1 Flavodoxin [Clostridium ljungdahlii DSM 13528]OVY49824.1 Flavodoxin [Clostridium autoethanogenum]